jgi:hypothetical protein
MDGAVINVENPTLVTHPNCLCGTIPVPEGMTSIDARSAYKNGTLDINGFKGGFNKNGMGFNAQNFGKNYKQAAAVISSRSGMRASINKVPIVGSTIPYTDAKVIRRGISGTGLSTLGVLLVAGMVSQLNKKKKKNRRL